MTSELAENIGLHGGTSGIALFLVYYDRLILQQNDLSQRVVDILEHNVKCIDSEKRLSHTICNGVSGFGWFCEHLRKMGMLYREDIEFLDALDLFLFNRMVADIKRGYYDYLHGALGVATYFLTRFNRKKVPEYLNELLTELEKSGEICENDAIKWISLLNHETGEKGYNISLSHGMSSIAAFLVRLHQLNFETKRVECLLTRTCKYILDQITFTDANISYFPSYSKESLYSTIENHPGNNYSRLGWCYGDLGIAPVIRQAAIVLKNKEWENTAMRILYHTTNRRDLRINSINDAGLCHGSAGIAHIFWNLYLNTQIEEFRETTDYWLYITLQMAKYADGLAGFKAWHTEEYGGPAKSATLLEGIAGIGLALLSYMKNGAIAWDECLLLSS